MGKQNLLLLLFGFSARLLFGQDVKPLTDEKEFLSKLKEVSTTTQSIKADFTEEKFLSYLKEPVKSTGVFYYKKENKMRWEKSAPSQYIFLVNGDKVKIKEQEKEKDVSSFNQVIGRIKEMMLTLVNGEFNTNKAYTPVYFYNDDIYLVKLVPKNKRLASVFDSIQLTFSKKTMRLKELAFYEKSGDKSIMKFFNDTVNTNLREELFINF
ncbi:MAG TPA: outer membrane lipoprotein carrier protein LolA [Bacteroidia bacterium]|nr:outer membrane lipoprotein carrier protein LolA [Bacteroidia bacterium]